MAATKPLRFQGSSWSDLKRFPRQAQQDAGYELHLVQIGREPSDWKPMPNIGAGVCEIRINDTTGAYRIIYIAKLTHAVYVLHCFQKKSRKTTKPDIDLAKRRFNELCEESRQ